MKLNDQIRFVRQNMKKNKTRLFMTVLATAMGCAFLIVLASVGFGLQKSIVDKMVGDRLVTAIDVWGKQTNSKDENAHMPKDEDIAYLRTIPNVKAVTFRNYLQQSLDPKVGSVSTGGGGIVNVDFVAEGKTGFALSAGRLPQGANEVVVGYNLRQQELEAEAQNTQGNTTSTQDNVKKEAPPAKDWIGKTLNLEVMQNVNGVEQKTPLSVTIVGVTSKPTREWKEDRAIYIGDELLKKIEGIAGTQFAAVRPAKPDEKMPAPKLPTDPRQYNQVQIIADSAAHVKAIGEELRGKGFLNHSIADELKQVNVIFLVMKIGLIFVGTIAVLIASIGIFNTMTMAVTERSQDIGIMKAIGAHPSAIRRIFLLESGMIGIFGAIIGIIVSYVLSIAVNIALPMIIRSFMSENMPKDFQFSLIPPYLALLAAVISLGVAVISGWRPAARATRVDVLRALRRDV